MATRVGICEFDFVNKQITLSLEVYLKLKYVQERNYDGLISKTRIHFAHTVEAV